MGEIADMMLDGTLCQSCGEWLGGDAVGYPVTCAGCEDYSVDTPANEPKGAKTVLCPDHPACERRFRTREAAAQHWVTKHG